MTGVTLVRVEMISRDVKKEEVVSCLDIVI